MSYKFQLGDAILSGALKQEGDIDIVESGKLKVGSTVVIDAARNLSASTLDGQLQNPATGLALADTDDVAEGSTNLYYTDARSRAAISEVADILAYNSSTGVLSVVDAELSASVKNVVAGHADTIAAVRGHVSVTNSDTDALSQLAYNSSTGVFTFDGLGADEIRNQISASSTVNISASYAKHSGVMSATLTGFSGFSTADLAEGANLYYTDARARAAISETADILAYDSGTGVLSVEAAALSGSTADIIGAHAGAIAAVRSKISVTDAGGDGSLAYNSSTGVITYTGPSAAEVRAHMTGGEMITFSGGEIKITAAEFSASWADVIATKDTGDLAEGSNKYFTEARARAALSMEADRFIAYDSGTGAFTMDETLFSGSARGLISVTDAGGDGSLAYNSATGVITYTGPSASEVRAHLSAGEMLDFTGGVFKIAHSEFSGSFLDTLAHADSAAGVRGHLSVTDTNSMDMSFAGGAISADLKLNSGDGDNSFEVAAGGLRLKSSVAGAGLTLTSGVLSLDGNVPNSVGDADATLVEGFNYGSADLTANRTWTLPASPSAGDVVHVKAPLVGSNKLIVAAGAGDNIDGVAQIEIESDSGAVSLMAISDAAWRIF